MIKIPIMCVAVKWCNLRGDFHQRHRCANQQEFKESFTTAQLTVNTLDYFTIARQNGNAEDLHTNILSL